MRHDFLSRSPIHGGPYAVMTADPPWHLHDQLPGERGAGFKYLTMSVDQICAMVLPLMTDNCVLYLWRLASMQADALRVMRAWGFELKTEIIWKKLTSKGKRHFGMGRIVRAEHEVCLIGTYGRPQVLSHSIRSIFEAPVGRHSEKPEEFYGIVERTFAGPYVELFARASRPGWMTVGNEA